MAFWTFPRLTKAPDSHSHKLESFVDPKVLMEKIQSGNGVVEYIFFSFELFNLLFSFIFLSPKIWILLASNLKPMDLNTHKNENGSEDIEIKHEPLEPDVENFVSHFYIIFIQV